MESAIVKLSWIEIINKNDSLAIRSIVCRFLLFLFDSLSFGGIILLVSIVNLQYTSSLVPSKPPTPIGVREVHLNSTYILPAWHSSGSFISRGSITMVSNSHAVTFEQVNQLYWVDLFASRAYTCFLRQHIVINASSNEYVFISCIPLFVFL